MSRIILDFGSGNTCKNDFNYVKRMIGELRAIDTGKHEVIIKWQLFKKAGDNIPLNEVIFIKAYNYAKTKGYKTTSSVFDKESLDFLLQFDIPFIKIANIRETDYLMDYIPRKIPIVISQDADQLFNPQRYQENITKLLCVRKYPATMNDYEENNNLLYLMDNIGISDHTAHYGLWYKYSPQIIEWHYGLEDSTGLDAGIFMRTPKQLAEIL